MLNPDQASPATCDSCGDDGTLYLHSRCHVQSPTWAVLTGDILTIECAECEGVIVRFQIMKVLDHV